MGGMEQMMGGMGGGGGGGGGGVSTSSLFFCNRFISTCIDFIFCFSFFLQLNNKKNP